MRGWKVEEIGEAACRVTRGNHQVAHTFGLTLGEARAYGELLRGALPLYAFLDRFCCGRVIHGRSGGQAIVVRGTQMEALEELIEDLAPYYTIAVEADSAEAER